MQQANVAKRQVVVRFKRFSGKAFGAFHSMHRVVNIGVLAGLTLSAMALPKAEAQNTRTHKQQTSEQELEEVTVTASKIATPLAQIARQVTVISQREIASAPVRSLQDLLVYSAGVDVQQRGGHGVQADISIRGGSFDQNAVLLNGVNLSNAETGHLSYDIPINLSDIERIEIIHGASGLIYGSAAFTGGINIITKKEVHERLYAQITYGQHRTHSAEGRLAFDTGQSTHSISVGHKASAGYTDNTDYKILNVLAQSNLHLGAHNKLHFNLGFNDKAYGANAFYSPKGPKQYEETDNLVASLKGELGTERLRIVPILYWNRVHDQYHWVRGTALNHHRADHMGGNLILAYQSSLGTTSLGVELRREDILSNRLGFPTVKDHGKYNRYATRTNTSLSLEHSLSLAQGLSVSAGALLNHNTQRQGKYEFLPSLSATYRPTSAWTISAAWSESVRIPTFIDLFYVGPAQHGNSHVQPERSRSLELSAKYRHRALDAYVTGFALWGQDIIDWVKLQPTDAKYQSYNIGYLNTYGIELGLRLRLAQLFPSLHSGTQLRVDYARMTQSHDSNNLSSLYVMRYLRDKLTARLDLPVGDRFTSSWSLRWQKRMGEFQTGVDASGVPSYSAYPGFATLDARLDYRLLRGVELSLSLNNLTNTKYFDFAAVHQPGFWASLGLTYRLAR